MSTAGGMAEGGMSEAHWEVFALEALADQEWRPVEGKTIAPGSGERESWDELVIPSRLLAKLRDLNPLVPPEYLKQAAVDIVRPTSGDAMTENHRAHSFMVEGYRGISWIDIDGAEQNPTVRLVSTDPSENDWLAVNQVTIRSTRCRAPLRPGPLLQRVSGRDP